METFKEKMKAMRKRTGLSQNKFGVKYHISMINIANWEQGVTAPPEYVQYLLERVVNEDYSEEKNNGQN